jgi:hypothetical protein
VQLEGLPKFDDVGFVGRVCTPPVDLPWTAEPLDVACLSLDVSVAHLCVHVEIAHHALVSDDWASELPIRTTHVQNSSAMTYLFTFAVAYVLRRDPVTRVVRNSFDGGRLQVPRNQRLTRRKTQTM